MFAGELTWFAMYSQADAPCQRRSFCFIVGAASALPANSERATMDCILLARCCLSEVTTRVLPLDNCMSSAFLYIPIWHVFYLSH